MLLTLISLIVDIDKVTNSSYAGKGKKCSDMRVKGLENNTNVVFVTYHCICYSPYENQSKV